MSSEKDFNWYVVRIFTGHEKKIQEYLEREIPLQGLEDKINDILIPTETIVEVRSGKKKTKEKNFFPGYMLIQAVYDESVNNLLQSTPSCLGFLKSGRGNTKPTPLRDEEVKKILSRARKSVDDPEDAGLIDIPFKEGDVVEVIDGPFKDFDGTVQEVNKDKLKLKVMVSIFGRKTPVEVDVNQVEPAS